MVRGQTVRDSAIHQNESLIRKTIDELIRKEYTMKFRREANCLYCFDLNQWILPADFTIDEYFYFEELIHPDADRMLFAISLPQGQKGWLVDSCNVYADNISSDMMEKFKFQNLVYEEL